MGPAPERSKKLESAARRINRLRSSSSHMPWWLALDALMEIGHQLDEHNFIILDDFSAAMAAIRDDVHASLKHCRDDDDATKDTRSAARIGDASRSGRVSALRSDLSIWARIGSSSSSGSASVLNRPSRPALDSLADDAEALVSALRDNAPGTDTPHNDASVSALAFARTRRQLANVRWRSDAMLACYPRNGSRYVRHLDNVCTAGGEGATCNGRRLTLVYYLNERARDVRSRDAGGELRIFRPGPPTSDPLIDVEPLANRLALFWSDDRTPRKQPRANPPHVLCTRVDLKSNTCACACVCDRRRAADRAAPRPIRRDSVVL